MLGWCFGATTQVDHSTLSYQVTGDYAHWQTASVDDRLQRRCGFDVAGTSIWVDDGEFAPNRGGCHRDASSGVWLEGA